jgi:hypothetical protein
MLDQYIENLVRSSKVQNKLDSHLEGLAKKASAAVDVQSFLEKASVEQLAKLAGITLPEDVCGGCGSQMEKLGSIFQCGCGLMKKAKKKTALMPIAGATRALSSGLSQSVGRLTGRLGAGRAARAAASPQTAAQKAAPLMTGAGGGNLTARELASAQGPMQRAAGAVSRAAGGLKQKLMPSGGMMPQPALKMASVKSASIAKFAKVMKAYNGDVDKALGHLEREGYTKLAFGMKEISALGSRALGAVKSAPGAIADKARQVGSTYTRGTKGVLRQGNKVTRGGTKGVLGGLGAVVKTHPGVAAGAAGTAGLGAGYMLGKEGAARLLRVGDAAGRVMAKVAVDINQEEVEESIEGARDREDVPGRAHRWGLGGGLLGGLAGGGAGYGAARMLGAKNPWLRAGAAGVGALAGGAGGSFLGAREGAEEAEADRLVSMIRGRRAYMTGAGEGMQQGYLHGLTQGQGGDEAGESGPQ